MKLDPYEELGVSRDATEDEIAAAARKHAKETHPDKQGGDKEAFERGRRALMILKDPKRRERYDRTGDAEDVTPDNTAARAMQIIEAKIFTATNAYLTSGFDPQKDPRVGDLLKTIMIEIKNEISMMKRSVAEGQKHAKFLKDLAKRFARKKRKAGFDFIKRRFENEIADVEAKVREVEQNIEGANMALEILADYEFAGEQPPTSAATGSTWGFSNSFIARGF